MIQVSEDAGNLTSARDDEEGLSVSARRAERRPTIRIASWNVNSIRARIEHVTNWLTRLQPDVVLLQELKGPLFPAEVFSKLGYESAAVTQKAYNGVAVLSRSPIQTISTALDGDDADSHARFLEVIIRGMRIVNIYAPNGNPIGSEKFAYKLAWDGPAQDEDDRLARIRHSYACRW